MGNIRTTLNWFEQRAGKVKYSMASRYGPNSFDCSSSVYYACQAGGFFPKGTMGNTDTLFTDLPKNGFVKVSSPYQRGDIFLWGRQHSASGRYGHTGMFIDANTIIHCSPSTSGIGTRGYQAMLNGAGNPPTQVWRHPSASSSTPTLNTPQEKVVWAVANILNGFGYNTVAIAGIIGNMVAESDLNPNLDQVGGPAFGLVQWDGSAYPLIGTPTRSGREYVRRLMTAGGVKGDYTKAEPQTRLIEWCMHNGQWIGAVEPKTVDGYKNISSVAQAAEVFMRNFERPGTERLDVRINGAQQWYTWLTGQTFTEKEPEFETLTNVGELERLSIASGKIIAEGWHFSSDRKDEEIIFYNAETDAVLGRFSPKTIDRPDLKERYPNVLGVEQSGFSVSMAVPNGTAVYVKGIRYNSGTSDSKDELIFDGIIIFEQAFDAEVETYAKTNEKFYFEILDHNKLIKRGDKILNELSWTNELMAIPSTELMLPIEYKEYFKARKEVKIYINRKVFHGLTVGMEEDKDAETITVQLLHVISEWNYRQISTNLAVKSRTVNDIYSTLDFRYPNWNVEYLQDSAQRKIDYVYSRQGKLDGLTKTCELTDDLFWRVGFNAGRTLDIGTFGDKKPYTLSTLDPSDQNIRILSELIIRHEYENVINIATVYGEKSDSGMSSMSLREVYNDDGAQVDGFPIVIPKNGINNERGYDYIEFTKLAPNNNLEYAVIDEESIALEGGIGIEGTFAFNDLAPFNIDSKDIKDEDRAKASKTAYDATVKKLKQSRRKYFIDMEVTELPFGINVGNRVRMLYDNQVLIQNDCSDYLKKILTIDEWYYIVSIGYDFDNNGVERNRVTLAKYLYTERESEWQ